MEKRINLIGISGKIGSGKDTVGNIIQYLSRDPEAETFESYMNSVRLTSSKWEVKKFAYKLKQIASILTGIPIEKFEDQEFKKTDLGPEWNYWLDRKEYPMTVRLFLQRLGTEAIRNGIHEQAWVNALFADYSDNSSWLVTDMRFPNEVASIKERGGITLRINRPNVVQLDHPSETLLDNYEFDYVIENDGTIDELIEKVRVMMEHFKLL
jgi:hypothetical protein